MVVETIEVQVKGKGIDSVIKQLKDLANACKKVSDSAFKNANKATKNLTRQLGKLGNQYKKVGSAASGAASQGAAKLGKSCNALSRTASKTKGILGTLISSLGRIAFYRIMRSITKSITDAFSTGLENVYRFSQIMGTTFANTMDNMATKSYTMKNQLGAAFAGLLSAIMPILLKLISLVTQAANAITMLFSAFSGGTYLKAKDTFQSWKDTAVGGAAATEEWKNQLLGFDEINKLEDQSSNGSGGGSSTPDYANMFEEVAIPEKLQQAVAWIKDHLEEIKRLAISIGAALIAWKIIKYISQLGSISNLLSIIWTKLKSFLAPLLTIAGIALTIYGIWDMWINGIDWDNLSIAILGIELATLGLYLAFGKTAAAIALLVGGIALIVVGFKEWIQTGEASTQTLVAITVGLLAVGAAIALLTGSWIPLAIAAIGVAIVWLIGRWDYIKAFFAATGEYLYNVLSGAWDKIAGTVTGNTARIEEGAKKLGTTWSDCWKNATKDIDSASKSTDKSASNISNSLTSATSAIQSKGGLDLNLFSSTGTTVFDQLLDTVNTDMPEALSTVEDNTKGMKEVTNENLQQMNTQFKNNMSGINSTASSGLSTLASTFSAKFSNIASSVYSSMSSAASYVWSSINSMQSAISSLNFSMSSSVGTYTKIRRYASGGTPATGSLFVAGERGAELVSSANGTTSVSNGDQIADSVSIGNENVVNAVYAMANAIVKSIDSKDMDVSLDGMSLARNMYKYNNRVSNEHGKSLVNYG